MLDMTHKAFVAEALWMRETYGGVVIISGRVRTGQGQSGQVRSKHGPCDSAVS